MRGNREGRGQSGGTGFVGARVEQMTAEKLIKAASGAVDTVNCLRNRRFFHSPPTPRHGLVTPRFFFYPPFCFNVSSVYSTIIVGIIKLIRGKKYSNGNNGPRYKIFLLFGEFIKYRVQQ